MSPAIIASLLGVIAIACSFVFAGWLLTRHERRLDAQLAAELDKLHTLIQAVAAEGIETGAVGEIRVNESVKAADGEPDRNVLDQITLRAKKKPN